LKIEKATLHSIKLGGKMRYLIFALFLLAFMPSIGSAQTDTRQSLSTPPVSVQAGNDHRAIGYVFVGPGALLPGNSTTFLNFGGGGEGLIKGGFSVGGEVGGFVPARDFGGGFGIVSATAGYHVLKASQSGKVVPFVSGGYSVFIRSGADNGINFGGGVDYWFKEHVGLRFEIRDHVPVPTNAHFVGFRVGLSFR
jgi:hypothetical protein